MTLILTALLNYTYKDINLTFSPILNLVSSLLHLTLSKLLHNTCTQLDSKFLEEYYQRLLLMLVHFYSTKESQSLVYTLRAHLLYRLFLRILHILLLKAHFEQDKIFCLQCIPIPKSSLYPKLLNIGLCFSLRSLCIYLPFRQKCQV